MRWGVPRLDARVALAAGILVLTVCGLAYRTLRGPGPLAGARINRGLIHGARGETDAACRDLQAVARDLPGDAGVRVRAGHCLAHAGRGEEAIASLRSAVELDARSTRARYELAKAFVAVGRLEEAAEELDALRNLKRNHADALYLASGVAATLGQAERACDLLEAALRAKPSYPDRYRYDPLFDPLRHDTRFLRVVRRHRLPGLFLEEDS
jgi:tetratricopeptide (TPR) repeat protein